jgi:hypothetical protein
MLPYSNSRRLERISYVAEGPWARFSLRLAGLSRSEKPLEPDVGGIEVPVLLEPFLHRELHQPMYLKLRSISSARYAKD